MNQRTEVTEYIARKLSLIKPENGYATDVGRLVYVGNVTMQEIETPCIVLIPEDESPRYASTPSGAISINYQIFAFSAWTNPAIPFDVAGGNDGEYKIIDYMLNDIKIAIGDCQDNNDLEIINYISGDAIYSADGGGNIGAQVSIEAMTKEKSAAWE